MTVSYTVHDYLFPFYIVLFLLGAILIVGVWLIRKAVSRWKRPAVGILGIAAMVGVYGMIAFATVPALEQSDCLLTDGENDTHTTAGTITAVTDAGHDPVYFQNGRPTGGAYLTIDGEQYYVIAHPELKAGMSIRFTCCPAENLILSWEEISAGEVTKYQSAYVPPEPVPERFVPQWQVRLGQVMSVIGFCGFAGLEAAGLFFHVKLGLWLRIQDAGQRNGVVPNPYGFWSTVVSLFFFFLIGAGHAVMDGLYLPFVILIPGVCGMLIFTLLRQQTRVSLEGQTLVIRRWRKESRYPVSDIRSVCWDARPSRGPGHRCLVIEFWSGGTLSLPQEYHLGLGDLYDRLTQNDL